MNRLLIVQEATERPTEQDEALFVLNDEASRLDNSKTNDVLQTLYKIDIDSPYSIPVYQILWTHLAANYPDHGSLLELIPLSERLKEHLLADDIDEIVIGENVQPKYVPLVRDVAKGSGCRVRVHSVTLPSDRLANTLETVWNFILQPLLLMLNQLLSMTLPERNDTRRPVATFPFPGRYDSTMPIARELGKDANCYVPHLGSDVLNWPDVDWDIPLYSYQRHSSLGIVRAEGSVFLELLSGEKRRELAGALDRALNDELGVNLPRTLRYAVDLVMERNARSILYYCWATDFLDSNAISAVLVGGPAPRDLAILQAAYKHNKDTYYVHHSVVTGNEFLPRPEATYFVPSEAGEKHIREIHGDADLPTLDVVGRPYIDERYKTEDLDASSTPKDPSEVIVTIATQPYRDEVRETFVQQIRDAADRSSAVDEIRVKIHPSESESYYRDLIGENDTYDKPISIAGSGLEKEISRSSLIVTINSNVGLEAMIQGTPAICYNEWHPSIQNKPYTRSDRIPVFDDVEGLTEFFESLTVEELDDLRQDQTRYAREQFLTGGKAAERIAESIRARSLKGKTG